MPVIKFDRVISCSSEDPNHPAKNLLQNETYKKWKCKTPGEQQISVVLQLEKSTKINAVDIGNEFSAFVEILVCRSTGDSEDFKVLLGSSSFMTPLESRNGEQTHRVRMFAYDHLSKPASDESWDRVKVVCRQPFNRHVQYGLSFLKLHAPPSEVDEKSPPQEKQLGRFVLREEDPDDDPISVGSLFAAKHSTASGALLGRPHTSPASTGAAAIMDSARPAALAATENVKVKASVAERLGLGTPKNKQDKTVKMSGNDKEKTYQSAHTKNGNVEKAYRKKNDENGSNNMKKEVKTEKKMNKGGAAIGTSLKRSPSREAGQSAAPKKVRREVPFSRLLQGVTLVISGYQNPMRANLRDSALAMGAKYRPDWGPGCTHLICAFPNTPKFRQVQGHGKIIKKEWIEDCFKQHKRLPWRRYALDKNDQTGPESDTEEEIESEETVKSQEEESMEDECVEDINEHSHVPSGFFVPLDDTPRASREKMQKLECNPVTTDDPYDADTDLEDNQTEPDTDDLPPLPSLPDVFWGAAFYLVPSLSPDTEDRLKRYITALNGALVCGSEEADYIIAERIRDCEKLNYNRHSCSVVRPSWVYACNDNSRRVETSVYELN